MTVLILYFSGTGNNRVLAEHLAARLGARTEEIRDTRLFARLRLYRDMALDRRPRIAPIESSPARSGEVLFVAPIIDLNIAHPMKTALKKLGRKLERYSFVTLCGYHRPGQHEGIAAQLIDLTGKAPAHVTELHVSDLLPGEIRDKTRDVLRYRVSEAELSAFQSDIDRIVGWFAR